VNPPSSDAEDAARESSATAGEGTLMPAVDSGDKRR